MLDLALRPVKDRSLEPVAARVPGWMGPNGLTGLALLASLGAAGLSGSGFPVLAVAAWLTSRLLDGLDGPVARIRGEASDLGGYVDMLADTIGYAAIPVGVGFGADTRLGWVAVAVLLAVLFVNTISWSYLSAILEKRGYGASVKGETTSITMPPALIEGTETIVGYSFLLLLPQWAPWTLGLFAALVTVNVVQRLVWARGAL